MLIRNIRSWWVVYYESLNRELKTRPIYELKVGYMQKKGSFSFSLRANYRPLEGHLEDGQGRGFPHGQAAY